MGHNIHRLLYMDIMLGTCGALEHKWQKPGECLHPISSSIHFFHLSCMWLISFLYFSNVKQHCTTFVQVKKWNKRDKKGKPLIGGASHPVGNPKRKVWWAQRQFSLSMKPRFNQTSRRKKPLLKVDTTWLSDGSRQFVYGTYLGVALAPAATWNLHNTTKVLCPNL
jgi:hypothetical protein